MSATRSPTAALQRVLHLAELGRIGDALPLVHQVLADQPDSVPALQVHAYCLQKIGRYAEMLHTAEHAVTVTPTDPTSHRQRARALLGLDRAGEAAAAAAEARRLDPHDAHNELMLVSAFLAVGGTANILAAADAAARARELDPESVEAYLAEGHVQRRMAEFERARAAYRRALAIDPDDARALYWLGSLDSDRGRAVRASPLLGDTLRTAPTDPAALRAAALGARRALWLLTDLACLPMLLTVIMASVWHQEIAGGVGLAGGLTILALGTTAVGALLRWRLGRLSGPTRTLIRARLWHPTFALAPLRLVSMALGGLLFVLSSVADPAPSAPVLTMWPVLLLVLRARNWLVGELHVVLRRLWFRSHHR